MTTSKLAIGGAIAGLVVLIIGLITGADYSPPAEPAANQSVLELDSVSGLVPIEESIALWQSRSDSQPLDYLSRTQLGAALTIQAREQADLEGFEAAEVALRDALSINPRYVPARLQLAAALRSQHQFADALDLATAIVAEKPTSLAALALAGDAHFELGNYQAAADAYFELETAERSAPVVSRMARLAWIRGDVTGAVTLAEEARILSESLAQRPSAAAFYSFQVGHFRFQAGDITGAQTALRQALDIAPDHPGSAELLAWVLASTGDDVGAGALYEQLLASGPAPDLHGAYADVLRRLGDDATADQHERWGRELAAETAGRFPAERRHLANFYFSRDPGQALELAEADIAERSDVESYDTLAWALHLNGRHAEAALAIENALSQGTQSASILYHAAAIADAGGDHELALVRLTEALAINPHFHPTEATDAAQLLDRLSSEV